MGSRRGSGRAFGRARLGIVMAAIAVGVALAIARTADSVAAADWTEARRRCGPPTPDEKHVKGSDFPWNQSLSEMAELYRRTYDAGLRLRDRAYYDETQGSFVVRVEKAWGGGLARLPDSFLRSVIRHIETALELEYAQFVFFPDMGHSHFHVPQEFFDRELASIPVTESHRLYEKIFASSETLVLYHTAEQLKLIDEQRRLLDDPFLQWRHYTRNPVGDTRGTGELRLFKDLDSRANTVREIPGHRLFSAGFQISASRDGCFPFRHRGQVFYFDLSLRDLFLFQ